MYLTHNNYKWKEKGYQARNITKFPHKYTDNLNSLARIPKDLFELSGASTKSDSEGFAIYSN